MILSNKEFFINSGTAGDSDEFTIGPKSKEILLSVFGTGSFELEILGIGAYPDDDYQPITFINNDGLVLINPITINGKYYAGINGYTKLKAKIISATGSISVIGTITD